MSTLNSTPSPTNAREQRGQQIAASGRIEKRNGFWIVPSQSGNGVYSVSLEGETLACVCPDFLSRRVKCKHIVAVEITIRRETAPDGTLTETTTVISKPTRPTYRQDWPAYNLAQTRETEHFTDLLRGLCDGIVQPKQTMGRPRLRLSDVLFSAVYKVYSTMSGRRAVSSIRTCQANGQIGSAPSYNSTFRYLEDPALTPILKALIEESASPLKAVETSFAVDSSGFSTCRFARWYDAKYGREMSERVWVKAHLMTGVVTNIVTSVEITPGTANDAPYLPTLATVTAKRFDIEEVSADKGYISHKNLEAVVGLGATPYIPFKVNTSGEGPELWRRLYHYYQFNREAFLKHYHKRSNVETTFSMIKGKFGDALRSKSDTAQVNEVLCKVLAHNLCVLTASIYELGITPTFWADAVAV